MHTRPPRPTQRFYRIAAAAICMAGGVALAQISSPGGGGDIAPPVPVPRPMPTPTTSPAPATTPGGESAENVLQALLRERANTGNATSRPANAATGPTVGADGLIREGEKIELRAGRLASQGNGGKALFVFDPKDKPEYPPMGVVPSRRLVAMEDFAKGADVNFPAISGEVTQYRGKNYLYIQPTGTPLPAAAINPGAAPAAPPVAEPGPAQAAPDAPLVDHLAEGALIINRAGRLVRDAKTGQELFVLDSGGKKMADPPMGVIPCRMLEVMEDQTDFGNKSARYMISGEVTLYRGRNYLYLKKMTVVLDLHQGIAPGVGGE